MSISRLTANLYLYTQGLHFRTMGDKYGYPSCCIELFINHYGIAKWFDQLPWYKSRNLKLDGYIPCEKCSNKTRQQLVDEINSRRKVEKIK